MDKIKPKKKAKAAPKLKAPPVEVTVVIADFKIGDTVTFKGEAGGVPIGSKAMVLSVEKSGAFFNIEVVTGTKNGKTLRVAAVDLY